MNSSNPGPIGSACASGSLARIPVLPPPGDCPAALYEMLSEWKARACGATPGCKPGDSKAVCATKMIALESCILARTVREMACFRGGDPGHKRQILDRLVSLEKCRATWAKAKN
jgi:hypothetical protein